MGIDPLLHGRPPDLAAREEDCPLQVQREPLLRALCGLDVREEGGKVTAVGWRNGGVAVVHARDADSLGQELVRHEAIPCRHGPSSSGECEGKRNTWTDLSVWAAQRRARTDLREQGQLAGLVGIQQVALVEALEPIRVLQGVRRPWRGWRGAAAQLSTGTHDDALFPVG